MRGIGDCYLKGGGAKGGVGGGVSGDDYCGDFGGDDGDADDNRSITIILSQLGITKGTCRILTQNDPKFSGDIY